MLISPGAQALANPCGVGPRNLDLCNHILCRLSVLGLVVILHFFLATPPSLAQGITPQSIITAVAGTTWTFRGDGGQAINAPLGFVSGIVMDTAGNLFAADTGNHLVVKISPTGILTVVAGNGIRGFSGDGEQGTSASLNNPQGVAVDAAGNLYVSDMSNNRIRKISPGGIISTVAGNGEQGFSGDEGPATSASLNLPRGVVVDATGNLYIADTINNRIRLVSPDEIISTVAGNGERGFSGDEGLATSAFLNRPFGIAMDVVGNLYVADRDNNRIRKVNPDRIISTVAGNGERGFSGDEGPATSASLNLPRGVAVDATGNLYVADRNNNRIRKISPGWIITTVAGTGDASFSGDGGLATSAFLDLPQGVAVDATGNLYIADTINNRIRLVSPDEIISTVAGNGTFKFGADGGPATSALLNIPASVALDAARNLYIADQVNHRIRKVNPDGIISTVAGNGERGFSGDGGPATDAKLNFPLGVAVDVTGNFYVADRFNNRIRMISPDVIISTVAGNGERGFSGDGGLAIDAELNLPSGVAVGTAGNLYIADANNHRIRKVGSDVTITTKAGNGERGFSGDGGLAIDAELNLPRGVAVDATGNLYIADANNHRIRKVGSDVTITTKAGNGERGFSGDGGLAIDAELNLPRGVAVDATGNLYIADTINNRIRLVSPDEIISTVAGTGEASFSGDGGLATSASLNLPRGVAVDTAGNLYLADTDNDRIRVVLAASPSYLVLPEVLSFSSQAGGLPSTPQNITVSGSVPSIPFSISLNTTSGDAWLAATPLNGSMPTTVEITADPAQLTPGTYSGTVNITALNADPAMRMVMVTFNVETAAEPNLAVRPRSRTLSFVQGDEARRRQIKVLNQGGGSLDFQVTATTASGGPWLTVETESGTATLADPVFVPVTIDPSGLDVGTYTGRITVFSSTTNQSIDVPVTITISAIEQSSILLSQTGLTFTAVANGGRVPPQTFEVLNSGQGVMEWSVSTSTLSGGPSWLTVSPTNDSTDAASSNIPQLEASIRPEGLAAGEYYGQVQVSSPTADNSPQVVSIVLNVLPAGSNPGPIVRPTGVIFTAEAGETSPGSQNVFVSNLAASPTNFASGRVTFDGVDWFVHLPTNATVAPDRPSRIVVQPELSGLEAGIRRGVLTLLFQDGTVRTVRLLFVLTAGAGAQQQAFPAQSTCTPTELLPVFTLLPDQFNVPAAWPTPVEVRVVDDCGNPMVSGSVLATFSNGDPPLSLVPLRDGRWSGTWQARNAGVAAVTITVTAAIPGTTLQGTADLVGGLQANPTIPQVGEGAVVSAASFAPQCAPSGLVGQVEGNS